MKSEENTEDLSTLKSYFEGISMGLKAELDEIQSVLVVLKPKIETITVLQETYVEDTNKNVHEAKHAALGNQRNMQGFTELTERQYNRINVILLEFQVIVAELRTQKKYTDEKIDLLESYTGEIRAIVSTQLFREIVEENIESKKFRAKLQNIWWVLLSIGTLAAIATGIIVAFKAITDLMK